MNNRYDLLRAHLVKYTCGVLGTSVQREATLMYSIIMQALCDEQTGNNEQKKTANSFFNGDIYRKYILLLTVNPKTMDYIRHNTLHVLDHLETLNPFLLHKDESTF